MISDKKIQEFGLSDKEAKVYMSLLELGQATAQQLSLRSGVNRATVYVMLESLMKRGLASTVDKDGKTLFNIEEPYSLLKHLEDERSEMEEKIVLARKLVPELQMIYNISRDRSRVRLFEGKETIRIIQKELLRSKNKEVFQVTNVNLAQKHWTESNIEYRKEINSKGFSTKTILGYDPTLALPGEFTSSDNREYRFISTRDYPIFSEIVLFDGKKVAMATIEASVVGIVLENQEMYETLKSLFMGLWYVAQPKPRIEK